MELCHIFYHHELLYTFYILDFLLLKENLLVSRLKRKKQSVKLHF